MELTAVVFLVVVVVSAAIPVVVVVGFPLSVENVSAAATPRITITIRMPIKLQPTRTVLL